MKPHVFAAFAAAATAAVSTPLATAQSGNYPQKSIRFIVPYSTMKALQGADLRAKLQKTGLDPQPTSPEEFANLIRSEIEKCGDVIESAGIPKV